MTYRFTVKGDPQGKARPRFGNGRTYTPEATRAYEELVAWKAKEAGVLPLEGPITLEIRAFMKLPQKTKLRPGQMCLKRPDADNIGKIIADALNKVAYQDDAQVWCLMVWKYWDEEPRVEIEITYDK